MVKDINKCTALFYMPTQVTHFCLLGFVVYNLKTCYKKHAHSNDLETKLNIYKNLVVI